MASTKHGRRVPKTQAQEALEQYVYASEVRDNEFAVGAIEIAAAEIRAQLTLSQWDSFVAMRDYAQYRMALMADAKAAETQAEIDRLSDQLAENRTKREAKGVV